MASEDQMYALADYMGSVSTAYIGATANQDMQDDAQKWNEKMADQAYERDIANWNRVNQYNLPINQLKRLKEAGINPWTAYGQMNTESASAQKAPVASSVPPPYLNVALPEMNFLANHLAITRQANENKLLEKSLIREDLQNVNQAMQNDAMRFFIEEQMRRELGWKSDEQTRESEKHKAYLEEHNRKIEEYARQKEQFEHNKSLWKYDETAKQQELLKQSMGIRQMEHEITLMDKRGKQLDQEMSQSEGRYNREGQKYEYELKQFDFQDWLNNRKKEMLEKYNYNEEKSWLENAVWDTYKRLYRSANKSGIKEKEDNGEVLNYPTPESGWR